MLVVQLDAEHGSGKDDRDVAFDRKGFFHENKELGVKRREKKVREAVKPPASDKFQPAGLVAALAALATTTATTTVAAAAATATGTLFTRTGHVDREVTATDVLAVQTADGRLGGLVRVHGDEGEAAGLAGHAIHHEVDFHDGAVGGKRVLEIILGGVEGKIPYKQFVVHVMYLTRPTPASPTVPELRVSNHHRTTFT
jgi:hypothetical protein